jgi:hypothetical protein
MPAFSFEKISPPSSRDPVPPIEKKQPGVIAQIRARFVTRVERAERVQKDISDRREQREPE